MKSYLKKMSIFKFKAIRALAVAALTVSGILLSAIPTRAATATPVTLSCQMSTNSNGYSLSCDGTTIDGGVALNCQTPNPINNNNGVFVFVTVTCSGNVGIAGTTVAELFSAPQLSVDSNNGTITASSRGTATLTISSLLSSVTVTSVGTPFSLTSSPLTLDFTGGSISADIAVLDIGTAQIASGGGSGSVSFANSTLTIHNAANFTVNASVPGLISATAACGSSVNVNLNLVSLLNPIIVPLASCSAS